MTIGAPNRDDSNEDKPNPDFIVSIFFIFFFIKKKKN
jgi:hypothetical protein